MPMKRLAAPIAAAVTVFTFVATTAWAHHGWTGYDEKTVVTVTGTVKAAGYENPHGYVDIETKDKTWHVVLAPPQRMESRGLAKEALKAGVTATVAGYANKTVKDEMRAERITIAGKTTELR